MNSKRKKLPTPTQMIYATLLFSVADLVKADASASIMTKDEQDVCKTLTQEIISSGRHESITIVAPEINMQFLDGARRVKGPIKVKKENANDYTCQIGSKSIQLHHNKDTSNKHHINQPRRNFR